MLCHKHNCVFVHIPKTAGMSVEQWFLDRLGLQEEDRPKLLLYRNDDPEKGPPRMAHLLAHQYVDCGHISADLFETYFRFSIVRNPYKRLISMYHYLPQSRATSFDDFVFNRFFRHLWRNMYWFVRPQVEYLNDKNGNMLVNRVIRFEQLNEDFSAVAKQLQLPDTPLPKVNVSRDHRPKEYRSLADYYRRDETRRWVEHLYADDLAYFKYDFPAELEGK
ncbi:sulfotransferase family 2 domain-containing protein [Halioglobus sp. HI00S01]|uniref:sulfotransferase family 2 domain-containing protein n=1 Tax=Halioglobus sp. HI00S01 TaxID=1822214 RepID=UPI0009EDC21D|nr:sulfotransferase family 2 domain-containing protein [Halioglobus sp. HI00S01]